MTLEPITNSQRHGRLITSRKWHTWSQIIWTNEQPVPVPLLRQLSLSRSVSSYLIRRNIANYATYLIYVPDLQRPGRGWSSFRKYRVGVFAFGISTTNPDPSQWHGMSCLRGNSLEITHLLVLGQVMSRVNVLLGHGAFAE